MGPVTKMFGMLVFWALAALFLMWGKHFFPFYLVGAFFVFMVFYMFFHKEPPDDHQGDKK